MTGIDLAVLTTTVCAIGWEVTKGAASEAGKDLWGKLKGLLPVAEEQLDPRLIAERLESDPAVRSEVQRLLAEMKPQDLGTTVTINVSEFTAKNVFNANIQHFGDIQ